MRYLLSLFIVICLQISSTSQIQVSTITNPFNGSGGLQLGPDGLLYVADFGQGLDNANGRQVWRIDFKNQGSPQLFASRLSGASGNDFDSNGNLFQSNIAANRVSKIDPNGNVSTFTSTGISCNVGINIDSADNLYVCNCCGSFANTIRKITSTGSSSLFASSGLLFCPNGITRDTDDNLYVSNFSNGNITKILPSGQVQLLARTPGSPASNGHIIYSEKENLLYVASHGSHRIYRLTLSGELSVLAGDGTRGNQDGTALEASFSRPNGLALSTTEDTLFVNSSIPTTDQGGRPLNPSVIRMITGLRSTSTSTIGVQTHDFSLSYDTATSNIIIEGAGTVLSDIDIRLFDVRGQLLIHRTVGLFENEVNIPLSNKLHNGLYVVQISGPASSIITKKMIVY